MLDLDFALLIYLLLIITVEIFCKIPKNTKAAYGLVFKESIHCLSKQSDSKTSVLIPCFVIYLCFILRGPVGNVSWVLFQEGRSSNLGLRRGVEQAAHTHNNRHVKCTGVYWA